MMEMLSRKMNFDADADDVPDALLREARAASRANLAPEQARLTYNRLAPALQLYRPNSDFAVACGLLIEKQRHVEGMLDFWTDLSRMFPDELTTVRMMMRWYRRSRNKEAGVAKLHDLFPRAHQDVKQAEAILSGFAELKAFDEIDALMTDVMPRFPAARGLQIRYVKALADQSRYVEANQVAGIILRPEKLGQGSTALLCRVARRADKLRAMPNTDATKVAPAIIDKLPMLLRQEARRLGPISFFTGQLGTGGAERQMTRIAIALHQRYRNHDTVLKGPVDVCVRHATASSGADFFLPDLRRARVETSILSDLAAPPAEVLPNVAPHIADMLELLPSDINDHVCKLVPYYQARRSSVAYLWQDGGVLSAAIAALMAGVPRIVTSFRGLPPNLRPNLFRPELEPLYRALAQVPHVSFTSNSQSAATAYEDWLDLPGGAVKVIPNAIPPITSEGSEADLDYWDSILRRSHDCTKTVLGVFRFDRNKRPKFWIENAARHAARHPDTRFVLLGTGYLFNECQALVRDLGMADQIFLAGLRKNVGFFLHRADLLMHLAQMEGLPNVLIEAHLAGLPVLATPAGGTAEVVSDGLTGHILSDAENPTHDEVTRGLSDLLSDPVTLRRQGRIAFRRSSKRFLLDHVLDQTINLFLHPDEAMT